MSRLKVGTRVLFVTSPGSDTYGTVVAVRSKPARHVLVEWDNGSTGLFYFKGHCKHDARRLVVVKSVK